MHACTHKQGKFNKVILAKLSMTIDASNQPNAASVLLLGLDLPQVLHLSFMLHFCMFVFLFLT